MTAVLFGPEGAGKSHIVASVQNEWVKERRLSYWLDCNEWPRDTREAEEAMRRGLSCRSLIIDDLGREPDATRVVLCRFIMTYINNSKGVLLITTNYKVVKSDIDLCDLAKVYGRAERSRMLNGALFKVDGKDLRIN